jgi:hypothetical protein
LSEEESKVPRQGIFIHADSNGDDHDIALRRAGKTLLKKSVREGEEYNTFAKHHAPSAATDSEPVLKIAMKLIKFEQVDMLSVVLPAKKMREEITMELTRSIVKSTELAAPVRIEYCAAGAGIKETSDMESANDTLQSTNRTNKHNRRVKRTSRPKRRSSKRFIKKNLGWHMTGRRRLNKRRSAHQASCAKDSKLVSNIQEHNNNNL